MEFDLPGAHLPAKRVGCLQRLQHLLKSHPTVLMPKEALFFFHFRGSEAQGIWGDVEGIERCGYGDGVGCRHQPGCRSQEGPTLADDGGGGKKPSWVWTLVMARTFSLIGLADVHS